MGQAKTIYLSLGSNVGDRAAHITRAVEALAAAGLHILRQSSLYATEPWPARAGRTQGWFLNCVVEAETELMPRQLLRVVLEIERQLGRRRLPRAAAGGPRVIDIDVLLFGSSRIRTRELEVPHPRLAERRFVLVPLNELVPTLRPPGLGRSVAELLADTADPSRVSRYPSSQLVR